MDKKSAFFIILSIVILAVMLYFVGIDKIIETLKNANPALIALAIGVQIFTYLLYNLRWKWIINITDIKVSFAQLLPITMVGLAVNNITPSGRGGGEPVRAYILAEQHDSYLKDTLATVVADRMLDTFPFIVLAIITIAATVFYFQMPTWLLIILILAVIAIVAILGILIYLCINPNFGYKIEKFVLRILNRVYKKGSENMEKTIHDNIFGFQDTMNVLISNRKVLYYTIPLSFVIWVFEILRVYIVFLAFGATLNVVVIGEVFIIASLVGMIPLLPGGLGAVDGVMVGFYSKAGVSMSLAAPVTLIERLISFWMATIIGLVILPHYGSSVLDRISVGSSAESMDNPQDDA